MTGEWPGPCRDDVCITCGDVAVPARVVRLVGDDLAVVEVEGVEEEISVALVPAAVGITVLVHAGEAIACFEPEPEGPTTERPAPTTERSRP